MWIGDIPRTVSRLGILGAAKLFVSRRLFQPYLPLWTTTLSLKGYPHPFHFRHATTDKYVIHEVLILGQYQCISNLPRIRTIVDAGANIGSASVFLLNNYPESRLIALEPDPGNFKVLSNNLSNYGNRAVAIRKALWPRNESLEISRGNFRDGGEWSIQVRKAGDTGNHDVSGTTIPDLMRELNLDGIDILKIDIEGAEFQLFQADTSWLDRVRFLAIEIHDHESRLAFDSAVSRFPNSCAQFGEVTLWRRLNRTADNGAEEAPLP